MAIHIFQVGIGLFILALLWILVISIYFITKRIKTSTSSIGLISILVLFFITLILSLLPRYKIKSEKKLTELDKMLDFFKLKNLELDWLYVWRFGLIIFNMAAIVILSIIIYKNYLSKKNIRIRNILKISKTDYKTVSQQNQKIL